MDTKLTLKKRLRLHEMWLEDDTDGIRFVEHGDALKGADISGANLRRARLDGASLAGACLSGVNLRKADLRLADCHEARLSRACLHGANLDGASLRGADLHGADCRVVCLRGANIDHSAWPLWCGSQDVFIDERIFRQLVDHLLATVCDTEEARKAQEWLKEHVGRSHRAEDLGLVHG